MLTWRLYFSDAIVSSFTISLHDKFWEDHESRARLKGTHIPVLRGWGKCTLQTLLEERVAPCSCDYGGFYQKWHFIHIKRNQTQPRFPGVSIDGQLRNSRCIILCVRSVQIHTVDEMEMDGTLDW
ncbi:hypothetical protein BCIN_01g09220 [Botrytis cinerea B05.10]|uniref:Uncharacterized protein n=1 Tax=Botryotinia fuckeliana (strain B05.10) TaxID=332648 RepID=A0A384J6M4_BOTFB|nr:hypothetical protein BCIN_01g09220 [Botrytis cinerea B05.10]ATZ46298.1 hypothetical protein BCIN_01g09220 [Botrytis cinerea B05.10]